MKKLFTLLLLCSIVIFEGCYFRPVDTFFTDFPEGSSPEEIGNRITQKFLDSPHSHYGDINSDEPRVRITYPDVCTWLGGLWFAKETENQELYAGLENRFSKVLEEEPHLLPKANHVDHNVFGSVPLELYKKNRKKEYLRLGLNYADAQWELPAKAKDEAKEWDDKGYSWQTRIWIDDMFMITAIQAQAFRITGERKYIDRAAKEMVLYLDEIQLESGLFNHSQEAQFAWGRGNGWMAVGMAEILRVLPENNPHYERIMAGYKSMMAALLKYQAEDGMWRQLVNDEDSWKETSGTGMFTYAMITGVKNGWLEESKYGPAARKGWIALTGYINADGELTEVCEGTNIKNERAHYMNRRRIVGDLHGQAPLLWCATALLRDSEVKN